MMTRNFLIDVKLQRLFRRYRLWSDLGDVPECLPLTPLAT
jgi:hypothetical protein